MNFFFWLCGKHWAETILSFTINLFKLAVIFFFSFPLPSALIGALCHIDELTNQNCLFTAHHIGVCNLLPVLTFCICVALSESGFLKHIKDNKKWTSCPLMATKKQHLNPVVKTDLHFRVAVCRWWRGHSPALLVLLYYF